MREMHQELKNQVGYNHCSEFEKRADAANMAVLFFQLVYANSVCIHATPFFLQSYLI